MTARAWLAAAATALLLGAMFSATAKPRAAPRAWRTGQTGRLDFDRARLTEVARVVAAITRRNIILTEAARRVKVSIFSPRPIGRRHVWDLFVAALSLHDLTLVGSGRFWLVMPIRDARGRR